MDLLGGGEEGGAAAPPGELRVNAGYARKFEHNKRRAELHRLRERHPAAAARLERELARGGGGDEGSGSESSSSESGMDEAALVPDSTRVDVLETLAKIKARDPSIYSKDTRFYSSEEEEEEEEGEGVARRPRKSRKKVKLRDYIAKRALAEGAEALAASDSEGGEEPARQPTYKEEQEEVRQAFLQAADQGAAGGEGKGFGGLELRRRAEAAAEAEPDAELLDRAFGEKGKMDAGQAFLRDFIAKKGWADGDESGSEEEGNAVDLHDSDDELEVEAQENFEAGYNFRYEEPGGARLKTHPRRVPGTLRKEESKRRRQRESKAGRQEETRRREAEEIRRLKNLKKAEIEEKLEAIRRVAGKKEGDGEGDAGGAEGLGDLDLDGAFDPEKFDRQMAALFDNDYYDADDEEILNPEEDSEDEEELAAALNTVTEEDGGGFNALVRRRRREGKLGGRVDQERTRHDVMRALDEYYGLDYEDKIGDVKCRFRYRDVSKKDYDLDAATILAMSDKELNQLVPLKKMAPYRGEGGRKEKKWKNWEVEWKQQGSGKKGRKGKWEVGVKWNKGTAPEEEARGGGQKSRRRDRGARDEQGGGEGGGDGANRAQTEEERRRKAFERPALNTGKKKNRPAGQSGGGRAEQPRQQSEEQVDKGKRKREKRSERRAKKRAKKEAGEGGT